MPAPQIILDLVQRFDDCRDQYRSGNYNEAQLRREFLDPLFTALGWDLTNQQGYAPQYREVIQEASLNIEGQAKAPDYEFRIGQTPKFFVEAKKPAVNIQYDVHPAFQLRRYAWSAHLPLSILTDFEEFAVYDTRIKPDHKDAASVGRTFFFRYTDYADKWDEIAAIFAKDAILKGSFDRYVQDNKAKKGTAEVDDDFLSAIETWRELLARNIALRNPQARSERALNYAVQMTLDRIIFLRICEDRGIEPEFQLRELASTPDVYPRLVNLYIKADQKYNSGLFHFAKEKSQTSEEDNFTPSLTIDDKALKQVINELYYPESPFAFKVIPVEILGQVYEQFLGKVIRLTPAGQAKVEEKPEVRKAGGVYYTPRYIVDYIVQNTVGKLLEGKTPQQIASLRVVDPACGSGSFLLGAYQCLLDWHLKYYLAPENGGPQAFTRGKSPALLPAGDGSYKLTTSEKKRILVNNIYGVDLDQQAVEVTKLSLLLKLLEEETGQLSLGFERVLPDLGHNIRCGNSLIGWDYFHGQLLADEEEVRRVNPFDWQQAFPEVFAADGSGGFDAVIGNPPYVRAESLEKRDKPYYHQYDSFASNADLYVYFFEKSIYLLNPKGLLGFISSGKFIKTGYGLNLRKLLSSKIDVLKMVDFGELPVFQNASTFPVVTFLAKTKGKRSVFEAAFVKHLDFQDLNSFLNEITTTYPSSLLENDNWVFTKGGEDAILEKLKQHTKPLEEFLVNKINRGIVTGLDDCFVISKEEFSQIVSQNENSTSHLKPYYIGDDIRNYSIKDKSKYLIFFERGWTIKEYGNLTESKAWQRLSADYPEICAHMLPFKERAKIRADKGDYWWELRACSFYDQFELPKICWPEIAKESRFTIDYSGSFLNKTCFFTATNDLALLGILNSKLIWFYLKKYCSVLGDPEKGGRLMQQKIYMQKIPIIKPTNANLQIRNQIADYARQICEMKNKKIADPFAKSQLVSHVNAINHQIDLLVYELYGLSMEEAKLVTSVN